jgi:hypothetical protein
MFLLAWNMANTTAHLQSSKTNVDLELSTFVKIFEFYLVTQSLSLVNNDNADVTHLLAYLQYTVLQAFKLKGRLYIYCCHEIWVKNIVIKSSAAIPHPENDNGFLCCFS